MKVKAKFLLILILLLAAFLRFWQLEKIPPGLYPDVALNGTEAFYSLKNFDFKVFYPENYGREGLIMWLIALSFSLLGISVWSIKCVAAFFGTLTVLGIYLLTKEVFFQDEKKEPLALLSSFFLATSFWHINFSRIGFRAILLPFFLCFSFYFLLKGFRKKSIFEVALAALFFGLSFYTYTSVRMAVLILPFVFLPFWVSFSKQNFQKKFWVLSLSFFSVTFLVLLPLGSYFLKHPEHFFSRASPVMVFSAENPAKEFLKSFVLHLLMFNFYGDANWRHNMAKSPQLIFPVGVLFLIGIFLSAKHLLKNFKNVEKSLPHWFLFSFFFSMLLPGILTREGIPHCLRTIGTIPPTFIFVGMGANFVFDWAQRVKKYSHILKNAGILFLALIAFWEGYRYFFVWAKKPQVKSEFTVDLFEMGNYLNSLSDDVEKYVVVNRGGMPISWAKNLPVPAQTLMFLEISKSGKIRANYLLPENLESITIKNRGVILIMEEDPRIFEKISSRFVGGKLEREKGFWVYKINL